MIPQTLSDQQAALNLFVLKWGWQIDHSRLDHYLAMSPSAKIQFRLRFDFAVNHSPSKSMVTHFDCLTNYTAPPPKVNSRAMPTAGCANACEWLQN